MELKYKILFVPKKAKGGLMLHSQVCIGHGYQCYIQNLFVCIDTNTSVAACRVSCSLNNDDSTFEIKRRGKVDSEKFKGLKCWFTNTGWSHRVFNNSNKIRINLLFGIDYSNIAKYFQCS